MDEEEPKETINEQGVGFKPTGELWGRFKNKVVVPKKLPVIEGESPTQTLGRTIIDWWLSHNLTWRTILVVILGVSYYILRAYISYEAIEFLIGIFIAAYIFGHFMSEYFLKPHIARIRKAKIQDDVSVVNVETKGLKVNLNILKAKFKPGEDAWEEYITVNEALDPKNPNRLISLGVTPIQTSWGKYIFAKEVDLENRMLIGDKEDYPAIALLPFVNDSQTYIPETIKWLEKLSQKSKITPEQLVELEKEGMKIYDQLDGYINKLSDYGAKIVNLKQMSKTDQRVILGLNRVTSRFFNQYKEYKEFYDLPLTLRSSRIMNAISTEKEMSTLYSFWLENMARMEQEAMSEALGVLQNELGITSSGLTARMHETWEEFTELRTLREKEALRKATGESEAK